MLQGQLKRPNLTHFWELHPCSCMQTERTNVCASSLYPWRKWMKKIVTQDCLTSATLMMTGAVHQVGCPYELIYSDKCQVHWVVHCDPCQVYWVIYWNPCQVYWVIYSDPCQVYWIFYSAPCQVDWVIYSDLFQVYRTNTKVHAYMTIIRISGILFDNNWLQLINTVYMDSDSNASFF